MKEKQSRKYVHKVILNCCCGIKKEDWELGVKKKVIYVGNLLKNVQEENVVE